jgi:hypothetical protein
MVNLLKAEVASRLCVPSCALIRQMSMENPLWGAPRIHGELLKLGPHHGRVALPNG